MFSKLGRVSHGALRHLGRHPAKYAVGGMGLGLVALHLGNREQFGAKKQDGVTYYEYPRYFQEANLGIVGGSGSATAFRDQVRSLTTKDNRDSMRRFSASLPKKGQVIVVNPTAMKDGDIRLGDVLKHEGFHQKVVKNKLRGTLSKLNPSTPQNFRQYYESTYNTNTARQSNIASGMMFEEYLAHQLPRPKKQQDPFARNLFSGRGSSFNTISGMLEGGEAARLRHMLTDFGSPWTGLWGSKPDENNKSGSWLGNVSDTLSEAFSGLSRDHRGGLANRWGMLKRDLSRYGKTVGTGHKRILIPKEVLSEGNLGDLGFVGVNVAIPEAGQTKLRSFRHPDNPYHLHEHGRYWTMHRDSHVASTMALAKMQNEGKSIGRATALMETIKGLPHLVTEGLPGLYYYLSGRMNDTESMASRLIKELPGTYKQKMNRLAGDTAIPGRDDAYNTIEGLRHGGMAADMRRAMTDFGSGWIGKLWRGTRKEIWEHTGQGVGGGNQKIESIFEAVRKTHYPHRPSRLTSTFWTPRRTGAMEYARRPGTTEGGFVSQITTKKEQFLADQAHYTEAYHAPEDATEYAHKYWKGISRETAMGPYATPEVLMPGTVKADVRFSLENARGKTVMQRLPTENRGVNPFDGMTHGGLGAALRKKNTPFGSKYDRARAIADLMGMSYDALLGSSMFRQALKGAKVQKRLGEGVAGVADLMKTTVGGHELEFVQKTLRPFQETVDMLYANSAKADSSISMTRVRQAAGDMRDLLKEGKAMDVLRDTKTVPSTYSISDDVLMMEAMPGAPLAKLKGQKLSPSIVSDMRETAREASMSGLVNRDIHGNNVMFDPVTGRTSWIDWGAVEETVRPFNQMTQAFTARPMVQRIDAMEKGLGLKMSIADDVTAAASPKARRLAKEKVMSATPLQTPLQMDSVAASVPPSRGTPFATTGIDGMAEGGLAQVKRKLNTEFGSAWRGMLKDAFQRMRGNITGLAVPFFGRAPAVGTAKLLDPRRAAQMYEGVSLGEFAAALTKQTGFKAHIGSRQTDPFIAGMAERFKSFGAGGASFFQRRAGAGAVVVDPTQLRSSIERLAQKRGIDAALTKKVLEGDRAQKVLLYHEFLEGQALARFPGAAQMGSHQTAHVMLGEAGLVGRLKDKELKRFFTQLRRKNTAEKDVYRAGIRGFQEEGEAAVLRKFFSDFGSGYQGLAASTSKQLIGSTRAKNSLHLSSIDLRAAQEKIWHCAIRGGRYHNRKNRDFVKQLSRFGGGV